MFFATDFVHLQFFTWHAPHPLFSCLLPSANIHNISLILREYTGIPKKIIRSNEGRMFLNPNSKLTNCFILLEFIYLSQLNKDLGHIQIQYLNCFSSFQLLEQIVPFLHCRCSSNKTNNPQLQSFRLTFTILVKSKYS